MTVLDLIKSGKTSIVILQGLTRHGKNRINQLISLDKTFKCGDEWIHDGRWVLIDNDPNFNWS